MTNTKSPPTKSSPKVFVKTLYRGPVVSAYSVHIPEGKFIVIDYVDRRSKTPDTEIYVEAYIQEVKPHTSEYKAANQAVKNYILDLSYEEE